MLNKVKHLLLEKAHHWVEQISVIAALSQNNNKFPDSYNRNTTNYPYYNRK